MSGQNRRARALKSAGSFAWSLVNAAARSTTKTRDALGVPVVSIGNIEAGGTGKTPMVIAVVEMLLKMGARPAVVSRGYRSASEGKGDVLWRGSPVAQANRARTFGDEATLVFERTGVPVFTGRRRAENFRAQVTLLSAGERPNVLVLDDGFQQFRLQKDLEVVCRTDATPSLRFFRDFQSALHPEHFVVRTKGGPDSTADAEVKLAPDLADVSSPLVLVTGIAAGERLHAELLESGKEVATWFPFADHHVYTDADIAHIEAATAAVGGASIVTTEKDWMKIRERTRNPDRYVIVPLSITWIRGREKLEERLWKLLRVS